MGHPERADGAPAARSAATYPRRSAREACGSPAEPPGDRPGGCATRDGHVPAPARDRITRRSGAAPRGSARSPGTTPSTRPRSCCARRGSVVTRALRLRDDRDRVLARAGAAPGLGAHSAVLPEATSDALEAFRLPLSAIAEAELVASSATTRSSSGRRSSTSGSRRRRGAARRSSPAPRAATCRPRPEAARRSARSSPTAATSSGKRLRKADRRLLVWSDLAAGRRPHRRARARAWARAEAGLRRAPSALHTERARGRRGGPPPTAKRQTRRRSACSSCRATRPRPIPASRARRGGRARHRDHDVPELAGGWADLILPATASSSARARR